MLTCPQLPQSSAVMGVPSEMPLLPRSAKLASFNIGFFADTLSCKKQTKTFFRKYYEEKKYKN
jgi:hypothetical protein